MGSGQERRLRTAVVFSVVCLIAVYLGSRAFDVRVRPEEHDKALTMMVPALGLTVASVYATWLLVAELLERRPALHSRQGRLLWAWTLVFCTALFTLGSASSASQTIGQSLMYASGLLTATVGAVGLLISAIPHRGPGATRR